MKLIKKITAAVTAMAMAAGMMSIGAGAVVISPSYSWSLSSALPPGAPSTTQGYYYKTVTNENTYGTTMHYHISKCAPFSSTTNSDGDRAHANYVVQITDLNHNVLWSSSTKMHKSRTTVRTSLSTPFTYGRYCVTSYSLYLPSGVSASISGNLYYKDQI